MPSYDFIKRELVDDIVKVSSGIDIVDELRINKKSASKEQYNTLKRLKIRHSPDVVALMLESKAQKRNAKLATHETSSSRQYNPILLCNEDDVNNFTKYLAGLPERMPYHYDIIFRPGDNHSGALQIHSDGSKVHMFFIENAHDHNEEERLQLIKALGKERVIIHNYTDGSLLEENYGCSIFAIQHLNSMNRLFNEVDHNFYLRQGYSHIENLDPIFLKHIQPIALAKRYEAAKKEQDLFIDKKKIKSFMEYVDNYTITNNKPNGEVIKRNYSILYKTKKYLEEALITLERIHSHPDGDKQLDEVILNRTGRNILNNIYQRMQLTSEQKSKVQGLYNHEQINLALLYDIPVEDLKSAKCFLTR